MEQADPANTVLRALIASNYPGRRGELLSMMSRAVRELPGEAATEIVKKHWSVRFNTDLPEKVMLDLTLSLVQTASEGEAATGYRVNLQIPGMETQHVCLLQEDGGVKILAETEELGPLAQEVLDRIARKDLKGGKILLDWAREDRKLVGGEDPYAGPPFPRLWNKNQEADAGRMQIAALALLCSIDRAAVPWIPQVEALRAKAENDADRAKIDEALMWAYLNAGDWPKMERAAGRLFERTESAALFRLLAASKAHQNKWDDLANLIQQHKGKLTDEATAVLVEADAYVSQRQPMKAVDLLKGLIDSGKADGNAINKYGWAAVIARNIKPEAIEIVQQAAQQPKNQDYALLHTLGCMYAEAQRTAQARQILFAAMDHDKSVDEPQSSIWFGFGLLAEGYGEIEAAARLYRKVEKPKNNEWEEQSTWSLAQRRLQAMGIKGN